MNESAWNARTFRTMAAAAAEIEAANSARGVADDPAAQELARWARERRLNLEARAEREERAGGPVSLCLFD